MGKTHFKKDCGWSNEGFLQKRDSFTSYAKYVIQHSITLNELA